MKQIIALAIFCSCFAPAWSQTQSEVGTKEKRELIDWDAVRDEKLNLHRNVKEMEIEQIENRMVRNEVDLAHLRKDEAMAHTIRRAEIDLEIDALRKEDLELDLGQIKARLKDGSVPVADKKTAYNRQTEIEKEIETLKQEDKALRFEEKEAKRKQELDNMSRTQIKAEIIEMKTERRRLDFLVNKPSQTRSQDEINELESRIKELTITIKQFEARHAELRGW